MAISNFKKENFNKNKLNIDINCDIGQSFGVYRSEQESKFLPYVSSVNIACGLHAGDPLTIMNELKNAAQRNLSIGAHIGYPDLQGFGYRSMNLEEEEMKAIVVYQIGALTSLAKMFNLNVEFVRPHGALYKQISENYDTCLSLAKAIESYDPWLILVGPPCENLRNVSKETQIRTAQEVHLDKKYNIDGSIDFSAGDIVDFNYSFNLLQAIIRDSVVFNNQNGKTKLDIKSIHLSSKNPNSFEIAKKVKELISEPMPITGTFVANSGWME